MRPAVALLGLAACTPEDPQLEAWHGPFAVEAAARADGSCDAAPVADEPDKPFLFIAVQRGVPDVASLYWCETNQSCDVAPWSSVALTRLTAGSLEGQLGEVLAVGSLCTVRWDGVIATQSDGRVELTFQTFVGEIDAVDDQGCADFLAAVQGEDCDAVRTFSGPRVPSG